MNNTLAAKFTWLPGFCDQRRLAADAALFEMLLGNGMKANRAAVDTRSAAGQDTVGGSQATDGRTAGAAAAEGPRCRRRGLSFVLDGTTAIQWKHERNRTEIEAAEATSNIKWHCSALNKDNNSSE